VEGGVFSCVVAVGAAGAVIPADVVEAGSLRTPVMEQPCVRVQGCFIANGIRTDGSFP